MLVANVRSTFKTAKHLDHEPGIQTLVRDRSVRIAVPREELLPHTPLMASLECIIMSCITYLRQPYTSSTLTERTISQKSSV